MLEANQSSSSGGGGGGGDDDSAPVYVDDANSPYPKGSILRFHGKRDPAARIAKGDQVVRSDYWTFGDQDGGKGCKGIVVDTAGSGRANNIHVLWKETSTISNYASMNLTVVGRIAQINLGDEVERGPDWKYGDQDGGAGGRGIVTKFGDDGRGIQVYVLWHHGRQANYRWGYAYDLTIVHSEAPREDEPSEWSHEHMPANLRNVCAVSIEPLVRSELLHNNNRCNVLMPGDFVVRGPGWGDLPGDQDGGEGKVGTVSRSFPLPLQLP
jgi:hypothetical protein